MCAYPEGTLPWDAMNIPQVKRGHRAGKDIEMELIRKLLLSEWNVFQSKRNQCVSPRPQTQITFAVFWQRHPCSWRWNLSILQFKRRPLINLQIDAYWYVSPHALSVCVSICALVQNRIVIWFKVWRGVACSDKSGRGRERECEMYKWAA